METYTKPQKEDKFPLQRSLICQSNFLRKIRWYSTPKLNILFNYMNTGAQCWVKNWQHTAHLYLSPIYDACITKSYMDDKSGFGHKITQ